MPLSEHEQRLLEQMERAFYEEDPQFASAMQRPRVPLGRRTALAIVAGLVGLGTIVAGLMSQLPLVGVAGFAMLLLAGSLVLRPRNSAAPTSGDVAAPAAPARPPKRSLSQRMEDRWDQRRGEDR
ncbi:MAG: DUF3040 domain-containing protein [Actinobacteria bacterium]|nr:DUF3040 domain-containing protein [Actinomycetota bacterium]